MMPPISIAALPLPPPQFAALIGVVAELCALSPAARLSRLRRDYDPRLIERVEGDGAKRMTPTERRIYPTTNRSIRAVADIAAGDALTDTNCAILRGESGGGGLSPALWPAVIGARARSNIRAGEGVSWEALLGW